MQTKEKEIRIGPKVLLIPIVRYETIEEAINDLSLEEVLKLINDGTEKKVVRTARQRALRKPTKEFQIYQEVAASLEKDSEKSIALLNCAGDAEAVQRLIKSSLKKS